ncbi:transglutaminase-like cysteine peptidase [Aquisediminimonas sediminicola]|uniref:transglutaminase-like cysteine peptidase n=1 Tax=Alteraquisediminimonas sediminicola TaxID=2676787 RepID=UPI001C8D0182|nr:transglutaminase-like cysteine peptidase [Aquisediminimonas sediminicola]
MCWGFAVKTVDMEKGLSFCSALKSASSVRRVAVGAVALGLSLAASPAAAFNIERLQLADLTADHAAASTLTSVTRVAAFDCASTPMPAARPLPLTTFATTASAAKTSAILGGAMSALEAMRHQQRNEGALAVQAAVVPPSVAPLNTMMTAAAPCTEMLGRVTGNAMLSDSSRDQGSVAPAVFTGRPDVFGSVAMAVGHTPLDKKWSKLRGVRVSGRAGPWRQMLTQARVMDQSRRIAEINHWVNARISFADDTQTYHVQDQWAGAAQTLQRGRGDCEDYAITKMQLLEAAGIDAADMFLVISRDLVRQADHAVLVVRDAGRMVVLDNGTDRVLDMAEVRDYRPIMSYNAKGAWLHGYAAPEQIQTAEQARPAQIAMAN